MRLRLRMGIGLLAAAGVVLASTISIRGDDENAEALRDGFETIRTSWRQEQTDATVRLIAHERSRLAAHEGQLAERFVFEAGPGSAFYYSHALPRVPISESLRASLYVRSNRAGIQLFARVVLPGDIDPDTKEPSFVLVPGTMYDHVDRWQKLELIQLPAAVERQARVLRVSTRRPLSLEGAYIDKLVVNLFGGVGETEVFLDDLEVAPVASRAVAVPAVPPLPNPAMPRPKVAVSRPEPKVPPKVSLDRNRLHKNGYDWIPTVIEAPGASIAKLGLAGFSVLADAIDADPKRYKEAVERGFLLMPSLTGRADGNPPTPEEAQAAARDFPFKDHVAFWNLGDHLGLVRNIEARLADVGRVRETIASVRSLPEGFPKLTTATVDGELRLYSQAPRNLDLIGIRHRAWATADEPFDFYTFLSQRRALTALNNAGGLFWAWIPAMPHPAVQTAVWGHDVPPSWGYPQVLPEQLRMYTYAALGAGYRGIAYRGDANLTRDAGRMLLIEMTLLNEEIAILESIIANGTDPIPLYRTNVPDPPNIPPIGGAGKKVVTVPELEPHPSIRAAAIGTLGLRGSLLLVTDLVEMAQYQPPQMAMRDLKITVPAPEGAQAWEISPGDVHVLDRERVPGGTRITVPEFCGTSIILVTTDLTLIGRVKEAIKRNRPLAVQMAIEQAQLEYDLTADINGRLIEGGHPLFDPSEPLTKLAPGMPTPNDEVQLLGKAQENLKSAREALEREDYAVAWAEARRTGRPLRILMFAHWQKAWGEFRKVVSPVDKEPEKPLSQALREERRRKEKKKKKKPMLVVVKPISSPPLVCINTLPQHYLWLDWMRKTTFSKNLVPSGSFDDPENLKSAGWTDESYPYEGITSEIKIVSNGRPRVPKKKKGDSTSSSDSTTPAEPLPPYDPKKKLLKVTVKPTEEDGIDRLPPFLDYPAAAVRSPAVRVTAGSFLRISVLVQYSLANTRGAGGIILRDSLGGEPLQMRLDGPIPELSKIVIFRRAPADGLMSVMMGLAGYGTAYFDDLKVEVVEGSPSEFPRDFAGRAPARRRTSPRVPSTAIRPQPEPRTNQ